MLNSFLKWQFAIVIIYVVQFSFSNSAHMLYVQQVEIKMEGKIYSLIFY